MTDNGPVASVEEAMTSLAADTGERLAQLEAAEREADRA